MTETFQSCRQNLIDSLLLNSLPTQEELESLLRITPQGIAKINADLNRGINPCEILNELATTLRTLKDYNSSIKYDLPESSFLESDRKFTPEEKQAIQWSVAECYVPVDCNNLHETLLNIIWEYRKYRLKAEFSEYMKYLKMNDEKVSKVIISELAPTCKAPSLEYVVRRNVNSSEHVVISVNPMFCWFDLSIQLEPYHFRLCQSPSLLESVHEDQGSLVDYLITDHKHPSLNTKNSFESLQIPYRFRKVRFADLDSDNELLDTEDLPIFKINAVRISSQVEEEISEIRISESKRVGVIFRLNSLFDRIRRPSIKPLWRNGH